MAEATFDHVAADYDDAFTHSEIGKRQRTRVWKYLESYVLSSQSLSVLELNCGTGEDAMLLAKAGHNVVATDASEEMLVVTVDKSRKAGVKKSVVTRTLNFNKLDEWNDEIKYDLIFSNFGGLNCVDEEGLKKVSEFAANHLKEDGKFVAVVMPQFCSMEALYFFFTGRWSKIFRRMTKDALKVNVDGRDVDTWYYKPSRFARCFSKEFERVRSRPVGYRIPPSFLEPFFKKRLWLLNYLTFLEGVYGAFGLFSRWSDHYIIELKKK